MLKNSFVDSTALSHAVDRVDQKLSGCRDELRRPVVSHGTKPPDSARRTAPYTVKFLSAG